MLTSKQHRVKAGMMIDSTSNRACKTNNIKDNFVFTIFTNTCTKLLYNLLHKAGDSCDIYLLGSIKVAQIHGSESNLQFVDIFSVIISSCPIGFALNELTKICQCHPIIRSITIVDSCNIETQTIPCPANIWITGRTSINNSHTYQALSI